MAAAAMHAHLPSTGGLPILGSNSPTCPGSAANERKEEEKAFVADFQNNPRPLSPRLIVEDPKNKRLGVSSKDLGLQDFELLKTLGTGRSIVVMRCLQEPCQVGLITCFSGTFARVWLARLAKPSKEDQDKVFALKILRKIDSKPNSLLPLQWDSETDYSTFLQLSA